MAKKTDTELAIIDQELLAELDSLFPKEEATFQRITLPRIGFASQDVTEGKGKAMQVVTEAGTFFDEKQTDQVNPDTGKKIWSKEEIGATIDGVILYRRYQLSYYDEVLGEYASTPVYDSPEESIPLFKNKVQIAKGTPAELKALYQYVDPKDGKTKSNLKDTRVLYILRDEQLYQLNLHGSSMYSYLKYERLGNPAKVVTLFNSEACQNGSISWNMMTFQFIRPLDNAEIADVVSKVKEIRMWIMAEKGTASQTVVMSDSQRKFNELTEN